MEKVCITFEDKGKDIIIGIENVLSDTPTFAQKAALEVFCNLQEDIKQARFFYGFKNLNRMMFKE